jgi:peroxisomal coenzyme A diphosphatase NUDT7
MLEKLKSIYENRNPHILGYKQCKRAAVMIPLVRVNQGYSILFQVRSNRLRHQPGEICFPGGRIEPCDPSERSAAVRETCEELGIIEQEIEVLGPLDFFVATHTIVYPYVCIISDQTKFNPDPDEVAEIFTASLDVLLRQEPQLHEVPIKMEPGHDFPFHLIPNGKDYKWRKALVPEYFYFYEDKVIWGLTARILREFLETVKDINKD